jgi:starvation-inducible outer membrane lipoprotein
VLSKTKAQQQFDEFCNKQTVLDADESVRFGGVVVASQQLI